MGRIKILILLICFFYSSNFYAQIIVTGKVVDSLQKPISNLTIIIKPFQKYNVTNYGFTNVNGDYSLKIPTIGKYSIFFNSLQYKKYSTDFEIKDTNEIKTINIILKNEITNLLKVEVKTENPISIQGDTTIIQVKPFLQGNESVVEDILKKLPGVNVDENGTVTVNNVEVSKIMVEGDDFFERGYKLLTKNMQSNAIKSVEILDRYSNNKYLKGVEHSEKVALNLKLKDAYKLYWFGNTNTGIDFTNLNYYDLNATLQSYSTKNKYFAITNFNNIGGNHAGDLNNLLQNSGDENIFSKNNNLFEGIMQITPPTINLGKNRTNINNDELINFNAIFNPTKKIKIKTILLTQLNENYFYNKNALIYNFNNTSFINNENIYNKSSTNNYIGKLDFNIDINSTSNLQTILQYKYSSGKNINNTFLNLVENNQFLNQTENYFNGKFIFTKKISTSNVFILKGDFIYQKIPQNYFNDNYNFSELFQINGIDGSQQNSLQSFNYGSLEANFYIKTKKQNTQVIYTGIEFRKDYFENYLYLKSKDIIVSTPNLFSNLISYSTYKIYGKTNFRKKIYKKLGWILDLEINQYVNYVNYEIKNLKDNPFLFNWVNGFYYNFNENTKLTFNYTSINYNNAILDIAPKYYQVNYRSFIQGLGTLNQLQNNQYSIIFSSKNYGSKQFYLSFNFSNFPTYFSNLNQVYSNYSILNKTILNNKENYQFFSSYNHYFSAIKTNFKINFNYNNIQYIDITQQVKRNIKNESYRYGIECRSAFKGFFNFNIGSIWQQSIITTNFKNYNNYGSNYFDLNFKFNSKIMLNIINDRYYFYASNNAINDFIFTDCNLNYFINKSVHIEIKCKNIFNVNQIQTTNTNDISSYYTNYSILPRIILLQIEYRF